MNNEELRILKNTIEQMACDADDKGLTDFGLRLSAADAFTLCKLEPPRRWIPCSERLPENRDVWEQYTVLLCVYRPAWYGDDEYTVEKFVLPAEYNYEQKVWRVRGSGEIINALIEEKSPWRSYISHWMPLPEPPEEGDAGNGLD